MCIFLFFIIFNVFLFRSETIKTSIFGEFYIFFFAIIGASSLPKYTSSSTTSHAATSTTGLADCSMVNDGPSLPIFSGVSLPSRASSDPIFPSVSISESAPSSRLPNHYNPQPRLHSYPPRPFFHFLPRHHPPRPFLHFHLPRHHPPRPFLHFHLPRCSNLRPIISGAFVTILRVIPFRELTIKLLIPSTFIGH